MITADFSTNADFPDPIKRYNTYRMRAFGFWLGSQGISVINNVRWGTEETWDYCFDGIPYNSIVSIGTVASGINKLENRPDFEAGLLKMVEVLNPHTIVIYGSANYDWFKKVSDMVFCLASQKQQPTTATFPKTSLRVLIPRRDVLFYSSFCSSDSIVPIPKNLSK